MYIYISLRHDSEQKNKTKLKKKSLCTCKIVTRLLIHYRKILKDSDIRKYISINKKKCINTRFLRDLGGQAGEEMYNY